MAFIEQNTILATNKQTFNIQLLSYLHFCVIIPVNPQNVTIQVAVWVPLSHPHKKNMSPVALFALTWPVSHGVNVTVMWQSEASSGMSLWLTKKYVPLLVFGSQGGHWCCCHCGLGLARRLGVIAYLAGLLHFFLSYGSSTVIGTGSGHRHHSWALGLARGLGQWAATYLACRLSFHLLRQFDGCCVVAIIKTKLTCRCGWQSQAMWSGGGRRKNGEQIDWCEHLQISYILLWGMLERRFWALYDG